MSAPPIAFLGVCDRIAKGANAIADFYSLNILGLRFDIFSHIFPLDISQLTFLFAAYDLPSLAPAKITAISSRPGDTTKFELKVEVEELATPPADRVSVATIRLPRSPSWQMLPWRIDRPFLITQPTEFNLYFEGQTKSPLGFLRFIYITAPPLSEERIRAIRSSPTAARYVHLVIACPKCNSELKTYASLNDSADAEPEGYIKHTLLPTDFRCSCGATEVDLSYLRESLHGVLGTPLGPTEGPLDFTRLYERSHLLAILGSFRTNIATFGEAEMQKFLEDNPIFLHRFNAARIIPQGSILGKYRTDFIIHSSSGAIYLIEIESPQKKLTKAKGHMSGELNHAIEQVRDWLHVFMEYRLGCLAMLGIQAENVTAIYGIVVIGRSTSATRESARKIRSADIGGVEILTYDDLATGLESMIDQINKL